MKKMQVMSAALAVLLVAGSLTAQGQNVTVILAGVLIDGKSDTPRRNQVIVIRGNKIESVGDATAKAPDGATVIDLSHATVMPGLIDTHTHIFLQGEVPAQGGYDIQLLKYPLAYRAARAAVSSTPAIAPTWASVTATIGRAAGWRAPSSIARPARRWARWRAISAVITAA